MSSKTLHSSGLLLVILCLGLSLGAVATRAAEFERPSFCDPTDRALNDGHGGAFMDTYRETKSSLSDSECRELADQLREAEAFARRFPTVAEARAAGWVQIADYVDGQGVHFESPRYGGGFDPRRPRYLLYDGTEPDARLSGMMFLERGERPPAGFPGGNDHWHNHPTLCFNAARSFVLGEHMSASECSELGGVMVESSDLWMVHVWLPVYEGWEADDVFNRSHPAL